ncbi:MAG: hypothetical protein U9R48_02490 [Chloroflexota bacterium]|nr:hypothetical protein [Chloroflexota bacterium]
MTSLLQGAVPEPRVVRVFALTIFLGLLVLGGLSVQATDPAMPFDRLNGGARADA